MAPRLSWTNLLPGLIALAAITTLAVGVVVFGGVGKIRGDKMRLYVLVNQARGVMKGTEVWLAGQKVGTVQGITFRPPESDSVSRVVVAVDVLMSAAPQLRRDSDVEVRTGSNIIGPIVIALGAGTPGSAAVRDGDTLRARPQSDMETAGAKLDEATKQAGPLMADARVVMGHVRSPNGTVGAAMAERGGSQLAGLRAQVARFRARVSGGDQRDGASATTTMSAARAALARTDSIRALLKSDNSSMGRFRRDSTLAQTVGHLRDELTTLRARLAENDGTLARSASDSALTRSIANAQREMGLLFDDIRKRPLRYVAF